MDKRLRSLWDQVKIFVLPLLVGIIGLIVSFLLYWQLRALDKQKINDQFSQIAQKQSKHLQWNLTNYQNALHSAVDLFKTTERVELDDFQQISTLIQRRYPEVVSLEWLPKVSDNQRESFVRTIRRQYDLNYQIREFNSSGTLRKSNIRPTYYPVTYIQPFRTAPYNQQILGFDHFSRKNRRRAIQKARTQGNVTITPSTVFLRTGIENRQIQSPDNNIGVFLYKPVFEGSSPEKSVDDSHEQPIGVIALSLKIQSIMEPVFGSESQDFNVAVFEHTSNPNNPTSRLMFSNQSSDIVQEVLDEKPDIKFRERFPVSDRSWSVLLWPTQGYLEYQQSWAPLLALGLGVLLTGALGLATYWLSGKFLGRRKEFFSIIDSAKDAIISTNQNGEIRLWNNAARTIFNYEHNEILGEQISSIIADEDQKQFRENLHEIRNFNQNDSLGEMMELKGIRKDGTQFPIELTLSRWQQQGVSYFTVIIRDVTERKHREKRLKELTRNLEEKVQSRTEELEQFVYAASHDLREPARVIQTYAGFLENDLGEQSDSDIQKDLRFIRNSAAHMNELINSLLTLSRINQEEIERQEVDVNVCVDQALEQQEDLLKSNEVTINRESLPEISADPALLTDLYQNLISNAIEHGRNGEVQITLTADKVDKHWVLGVKDNGPGIKSEHQDKIFEPFKRLIQSNDDNGTGIGLSICRRIIDRHNGKIWVESEPDTGAHFKFTLMKPIQN